MKRYPSIPPLSLNFSAKSAPKRTSIYNDTHTGDWHVESDGELPCIAYTVGSSGSANISVRDRLEPDRRSDQSYAHLRKMPGVISAFSRALLGLFALLAAFGVARAGDSYGPVNTTSRWTIQSADNHYCSAGTTYDTGSTVFFTGVGGEYPYFELRWLNRNWKFGADSDDSASFVLEFDNEQIVARGGKIQDPNGLLFTFKGPDALHMAWRLPTVTRMILRPANDRQAFIAGVQLHGMGETYAELRKCWEQTGSYEYREQEVHRWEIEGRAQLEKRRAETEAREQAEREAGERRAACNARLRALRTEREDVLDEEDAIARRSAVLETERSLLETRSQLAAKGVGDAASLRASIASFNARMADLRRDVKAHQARARDYNRRSDEAGTECRTG